MTAPPPNNFSFKRQALQAGASSLARHEDNVQILLRLIREQSLLHWKSYVASFGLMAVLAACVTATAYLIWSAVNATTLDRDFHSVLFSCAAIIAIFGQGLCAVRAGCSANSCPCSHDRVLSEFAVRQAIVRKHASSFEFPFRPRPSTGFAPARRAAKVIDMTICAAGREGLSIVGLAAVMIYQDPLLALGCLLSAPVIFAVVRSSRAKLDDMALAGIRAQNNATKLFQETLQGMRLIKTFGLEGISPRPGLRQDQFRSRDGPENRSAECGVVLPGWRCSVGASLR